MALSHVLKYPKCILTQKGRFLFIFEVFGVILMHSKGVFSENINLSKNRFQGRFYSAAYTDHQVQFSNGFAIFHKPQGTQGLWKIAKNHNPLAKFCSVNGRIFIYFFHFFQKKISNLSKK